jgi:agmatinase
MVRALPPDQVVAADLVEVSPPYDHAEITSLAAATLGYEITSLMARAGGDVS